MTKSTQFLMILGRLFVIKTQVLLSKKHVKKNYTKEGVALSQLISWQSPLMSLRILKKLMI